MLVKESLGRDILRLIVWYPIRWLVTAIPIAWGFALFRIMGDIHYHLSSGKKHIIMTNLQLALGDRMLDEDLANVARSHFKNHYINQLQIFLFPKLNRKNIENVHVFKGLENLEAALSKGKGCILVHPHFGPTQLPLCALGIMGYPMMQLGLPTDEGLSFIGKKVAFRLRIKYENKIPGQIVSADSFLRPVMNWLKEKGVLMATGDGAGGGRFIGKFIPIEFLGKPTLFPVGAATLAEKMGVPLLPAFTVIRKDYTYQTIIHKPINQAAGEHELNPIEAYTKKFVKIMEDYIYRYPAQWHFWDEWNKPAGGWTNH